MLDVKKVVVDDVEMEYLCFGNGLKPLVILPGISLKSICRTTVGISGTYRNFLNDYKIYVFDRRLKMPNDYSIKDMAKDMARVFDYLGLRKIFLYGISQGGMIALNLASYYDEYLERVAVCSTASHIGDDCLHKFKYWLNLAQNRQIEELIHSFLGAIYLPTTLEKIEDYLVKIYSDVSEIELNNFIVGVNSFFEYDLSKELANIRLPLLVQSARGDKLFGIDLINDLKNKENVLCFEYDEKHSHGVYDEEPLVLIRLKEFLDA